MGVVVHSWNAKCGGCGEEDCCKFEVSLGCTVIYSPEYRSYNVRTSHKQHRNKSTAFIPTFHKGHTQCQGCSVSAEPSWGSLWSHWWSKWPSVLDFLSPRSYVLQKPICRWTPRWRLKTDQSTPSLFCSRFPLTTGESWTKPTTKLPWAETSRPSYRDSKDQGKNSIA